MGKKTGLDRVREGNKGENGQKQILNNNKTKQPTKDKQERRGLTIGFNGLLKCAWRSIAQGRVEREGKESTAPSGWRCDVCG